MNIGISWHMTDDGKANANSVIEGNLRLYEGDKDYMGSSLDIYMESPQRAALAALQKHHADHGDRQNDVNDEYDLDHGFPVSSIRVMGAAAGSLIAQAMATGLEPNPNL